MVSLILRPDSRPLSGFLHNPLMFQMPRRKLVAVLLLYGFVALSAVQGADDVSETTRFRFGFSSSMLANVNHQDA